MPRNYIVVLKVKVEANWCNIEDFTKVAIDELNEHNAGGFEIGVILTEEVK